MSGDQKTAYRAVSITDLESDEEETKNVLFSYVCIKAKDDKALEKEQVQTLVESVEKQVIHTALASSMASEVGRRLAEFGDQVDGQFYQEMEEIVELTGTPEKAFAIFSDVVKNLFEWDENGLPKINLGRIAALLGYCYHLCRKFVQQKAGAFTLVSFLGMVGTWLVKFPHPGKVLRMAEAEGRMGSAAHGSSEQWDRSGPEYAWHPHFSDYGCGESRHLGIFHDEKVIRILSDSLSEPNLIYIL
uniref:BAK-2 protein n=1 Tax=Lubomirskia baikalensis TaxID=289074 RepID=Q1RPT5_9METZ|nr:BAK-2 protein [Lubomirskia baikalensis]